MQHVIAEKFHAYWFETRPGGSDVPPERLAAAARAYPLSGLGHAYRTFATAFCEGVAYSQVATDETDDALPVFHAESHA